MRTERVFGIIILIGVFFKFMHWPGGNVIIILSMSTLSMLYLPFAFYFFSYKGVKYQNMGLTIPAGICFSIALIGIMFKLMYWPGANEMILFGAIGSVLMVVLSFVFSKVKIASEPDFQKRLDPKALDDRTDANEDVSAQEKMRLYYKNMQLRSILISFFTVLLLLTPVSTLVKIQHRDDPEMVRLKIRSFENPQNEEYRKEYRDYVQKKERGE
ncbi:MAG: hypothetical protein K2X86_01710 [Cytophagaceae bacterium]|nr:hypothetical protein [Cytophagaceae bacterium]